ncbi:response regulator [Paenibacillus doosanensis]|uniref:Response regulator UvrY n=1 Tax=Paenibacillus konkukensis TaxID=2020716 RepID=A0ABY4RRJ5_9BACL|nr:MULTISPECIES: response regulator [Paenibacillus]MCS7459554.1 response regulator [Paenibacillus doosanensis]UQZ84788.1 Response regulator UvrY [Paenibacillus konkukensis]
MNILVVDDEKIIREGVKRAILAGYPAFRVFLAASPEEAIEVLRSEHVDIVFTDILMPGMTGLELMRLAGRRHAHVKWIVISAYSEFAYAQEAMRLGARDYLIKPIGKEKLIGLIAALDGELQRDSRLTQEAQLLKSNLKYLREAVFQRWASGLDIGRFDMSALTREHPQYYLIMVRLESEGRTHLEHFIVDNVLSELIERKGCGFVVSLDTHSLLGLVTLQEGAGFETFAAELRSHLHQYLKVPFQLAGSGLLSHFAGIPDEVKKLKQTGGSSPVTYDRGNESAIDVALQYIRTHYEEDLSLEKVASVVYLNPVYFSQLFKLKTGQGFKEHIIQLRMERAKELLQDPYLKIADIAERVGYQDMRHFTQVFRKKLTLTPTEYRRRLEQS